MPKNKSKKRKKKSKFRIFLFLIIALIIGICAYLLISSNFDIQEIIIIGNKNIGNEEILNKLEIKKGDNLFLKIEKVLKVKAKDVGYIEKLDIKKIYPNKIEIKIEERNKDFQIQVEDKIVDIDDQGHILKVNSAKTDNTIITGFDIKFEEIKNSHRLEDKELAKMEKILHIKKQLKESELKEFKLSKIDVSQGYTLSFDDVGIDVYLGDATELKNRMYYVNAIIKQEKGNKGAIYANGNFNEGFSAYFSAK